MLRLARSHLLGFVLFALRVFYYVSYECPYHVYQNLVTRLHKTILMLPNIPGLPQLPSLCISPTPAD